MAETGKSRSLRDEEIQSVPIVCEESPIAARVAVAVEPISLVKKKEFESEGQVDKLKEVLGGSLLDDLFNQNIELEAKVNELEERVHELETQAVEYQKELGLGFAKESDNQELIQALAKIRKLEATIRDLQNEKLLEAEEKKKPNKQKRKTDDGAPTDNKLKKKKIEKCVSCRKSHSGMCLKGKGVCYTCGQSGHVAPNCKQTKKKRGCFRCGAANHQMRNCEKKETSAEQSKSSL